MMSNAEPTSPANSVPFALRIAPYFLVSVVIGVSLYAIVTGRSPNPREADKAVTSSWLSAVPLPEGSEKFLYQGSVAFGISARQKLRAPFDGTVKTTPSGIDGGEKGFSITVTAAPQTAAISYFSLQAAQQINSCTYDLIKPRWQVEIVPTATVSVKKGDQIIGFEGEWPMAQVTVRLKCSSAGAELPPPTELISLKPVGADVFSVHCAGCHNINKEPSDIGPPGLKDFASRPIMARLNKANSRPNIMASLLKGDKGMPSFKDLSESERHDVVEYVLSLKSVK